MSKYRYFLPPLLASFSLGLLFIPLYLIENENNYFELDAIFSQIGGAIVFTPFIYMTALPVHLIGCVFIKFLRYINCYSSLILLISGYCFGHMFGFFFDNMGSDYGFHIIVGLSGMVAAWNYYYIDKKEREEMSKAIENIN